MSETREIKESEYLDLCNDSKVYRNLIDYSSDICLPRYYYFCESNEARLPPEFLIIADVRKVEIVQQVRPDRKKFAPLTQAIIKDGMGQLRPRMENGKQVDAIAQWKRDLEADFRAIGVVAGTIPTFICLPEFGFPYALTSREEPRKDREQDADLVTLLDLPVCQTSFVCLGSAHRQYEQSRDEGGHNNIRANVAVVYPEGIGFNLHDKQVSPPDIFEQRKSLLDGSKTSVSSQICATPLPLEFDGSPQDTLDQVNLTVSFAVGAENNKIRANSRQQMRRQVSKIDRSLLEDAKYIFAREALEYYSHFGCVTGSDQYVYKQSPARKIGEYLDSHQLQHIDVFVTSKGTTAVLICYDAYDPAIFMSAVRMWRKQKDKDGQFTHPHVDVWFIPSYNRSDKLWKLCKDLSIETDSIVVYLTGADPHHRMQDDKDVTDDDRFKVFISGFEASCPITAFGESVPPCEPLGFEEKHLRGFRISRNFCDAAKRARGFHAPYDARQIKHPPTSLRGVMSVQRWS